MVYITHLVTHTNEAYEKIIVDWPAPESMETHTNTQLFQFVDSVTT